MGENICLKCGWSWYPRNPNHHSKQCPSCHSVNWDKPKRVLIDPKTMLDRNEKLLEALGKNTSARDAASRLGISVTQFYNYKSLKAAIPDAVMQRIPLLSGWARNIENTLNCFYCGHEWVARTSRIPQKCPDCQERGWDINSTEGRCSAFTSIHSDCLRSGKSNSELAEGIGLSIDELIDVIRGNIAISRETLDRTIRWLIEKGVILKKVKYRPAKINKKEDDFEPPHPATPHPNTEAMRSIVKESGKILEWVAQHLPVAFDRLQAVLAGDIVLTDDQLAVVRERMKQLI